jgi:hypothetical protein
LPRQRSHTPTVSGCRLNGWTSPANQRQLDLSGGFRHAYRRKQNVVEIRHMRDHELIAMIEIVSRGNKSSRSAIAEFAYS